MRIASTLLRDIIVLISPGWRSDLPDVVISMEVIGVYRSSVITGSPRPADMHSEETLPLSKHRNTTSGTTPYAEKCTRSLDAVTS